MNGATNNNASNMNYTQELEALLLRANDILANHAIAIDGGHADALPLMVVCKQLADMAEQYSKQFRERANREAKLYGNEGVKVFGFTVKAAEVATRYDFAYPPSVAKAVEQAKEVRQLYEDMARLAPAPYTAVDEHGEVLWEVVPAIKKSTSSVTISKK